MLKEIISHAIKDYVIFQIYTSMQTFVTGTWNWCLHFRIWWVVPPWNHQDFNNAVRSTQYFMRGMHPEFRGHSVFGPKMLWEHIWPFQREWQSWAGLMEVTFPRALSMPPGRALSSLCTGRERGGGMQWEKGETWELFRACLHLQNKERGWQKDYSGYFLTVEGYVCDVASHCYIHRPVYVPENHSLLPPFFVFLLFCSLASPHSCFLYYFISVSESLSLPPPLSHSSSFSPLPSFSIPSSLPLPIFACATFNCSDMPCGKLCLCVLEQALLVMAVIPDARGGV